MSGGGGSSGSGGGFGRDSGIDCAGLLFDVFLSSVDPDTLDSIAEGDVLAVELRTVPARALVAVLPDGRAVGAITRKVRELLRCIQQQVSYSATVKNITGGDVEVRVQAV
jgi:hypothetical protein